MVLPAVSRMGPASGCGVAAGSPGRRKDVCRSRRRHDRRDRSGDRAKPGSPISSWRCWAPATTPTPKPPGLGTCRIGSAPTPARWSSSGRHRLIVPDQWKAGVNKPCYWEPELNRTYQEWAIHNGVAIVPARPGHARDKAKVEQGVLVIQRWVVAALRKRQFFSLAQLNEAIRELVGKLNQRPFRKLPGSRAELYEKLDRPALAACRASLTCSPSGRRSASARLSRGSRRPPLFGALSAGRQQVESRYTASMVEIHYAANA